MNRMIEQRLEAWRREGLIDAETAARIAAREATRHRPLLLWALTGLAVLAFVAGLSAIVAANWEAIPGLVKLGGHGLINAAVAGAAWFWPPRRRITCDILLGALAGLTLTLIGLIGQVYQLQSPLWQALAFWCALITPMLLAGGRTPVAAWLWLAALCALFASAAEPLVKLLETAGLGPAALAALAPACLPLAALAALAGRWGLAPAFATALRQAGWAGLLAGLLAAQQFWYFLEPDDAGTGDIVVLLAALLAAGLTLWRRPGGPGEPNEPALPLFAAGALLALAPVLSVRSGLDLSDGDLSAFAVAGFVAACLLIAWHAARSGQPTLFGFAVAGVAGRILIVVLEALGSLLATGVGLVGTGLFALLVIVLVRRLGLFRRREETS